MLVVNFLIANGSRLASMFLTSILNGFLSASGPFFLPMAGYRAGILPCDTDSGDGRDHYGVMAMDALCGADLHDFAAV